MSTPGEPTDYHTRPYRLADAYLSPGDSVNFVSGAGIYAVITSISATLIGATYGYGQFQINSHLFWQPELTLPTNGLQNWTWSGWLPWDELEHFEISVPIGSGAGMGFFAGGFYYTP